MFPLREAFHLRKFLRLYDTYCLKASSLFSAKHWQQQQTTKAVALIVNAILFAGGHVLVPQVEDNLKL
jgi:hypothetical protein